MASIEKPAPFVTIFREEVKPRDAVKAGKAILFIADSPHPEDKYFEVAELNEKLRQWWLYPEDYGDDISGMIDYFKRWQRFPKFQKLSNVLIGCADRGGNYPYPLEIIGVHLTEPGATFNPHFDMRAGFNNSTTLSEGSELRLHDDDHEVVYATELNPGDRVQFENARNWRQRPIHSFVSPEDALRVSVADKYCDPKSLEKIENLDVPLGLLQHMPPSQILQPGNEWLANALYTQFVR